MLQNFYLFEQCLKRGYRPKVTLIDAGYGNNTPFVKQLESKHLTYIAAIAKNRQVTYQLATDTESRRHSVMDIAQALTAEDFIPSRTPPQQAPHCLGGYASSSRS